MAIATGTRLGRYEILAKLGEGGMGEVYLARDTTELERTVAIKVLPNDVASDPERLRRFVQEAKTASSLNHPNILTIYEIGEADSSRFIATEYVEGETLRQKMSRSRLSLRESIDISIQIASALVAAHRAGVVHRDIKPENVMVREDGIVKVLDFGLAKPAPRTATDPEAATRALVNTTPGVVMGTVSYMSPEQARGRSVDKRTDIWSLGVLVYEMVAGRVPFPGDTSSDVIAQILTKEPPSLLLVSSEATERLDEIVQKALVKDREERYQHVKDLLIDLKRLKHKLDVEAEIERSSPPTGNSSGATRASGEHIDRATAHTAAVSTSESGYAQPTSSAEYLVTEIKRHKTGTMLVLAVLIVVFIAGYAYFTARPQRITSVAVLPFVNTAGDPEMEYLSDGISESLINSLSKLSSLKVIARGSSFKFRGRDADPQEVAKALGVQAVVSGRLVRFGDQLQVSAEMVDARQGTQMWGEQYNRPASDLLQVQGEISREIADKLRLHLSSGERQQLASHETANPQAYELLLKGRFYRGKGGTENGKKAIEYLNQALAVDPNYALVHAELSRLYWGLIGDSVLDPKVYTPKAEQEAQKALELDENLAEAHLALAHVKLTAWDWATAEREYKRAVELNPNLGEAHRWYSFYLSLMGHHDEAIAEIKRARALDPLSPGVNTNVGFRLYFARRYDEAVDALQKALELDQNYPPAHTILGFTYAAKGSFPEAIAEFQQAINSGDASSSTRIYLGAAYAKAGSRDEAQAILNELRNTTGYVSPGELAALYAALGEREQAFASLERAYTAHDVQLQFLGVDPALDPLRSDPRFQALMRRVGLPQ